MSDFDAAPVVIKQVADPNTPEAVEFFRRLGLCVATWAYLDRRLYQIFHHAIGLDQKQSAFLYYRNRAFNQRLRMVDDALKMFLLPLEYTEQWRPLHNDTVNLSHTRNIFAHHPTVRTGTARNGQALDIYSIYIEPYERVLNNDYPGLRGKMTLEVDDLKEHNTEAEMLVEKLHDFAWLVGGRRASVKPSA
jgi:hypothetical protein